MTIFNIDSLNKKLEWEKLSNGTYRAYITLGIADLPLEYVDSKGNKYTQIITEEELFNDDSVKSAYGLPILLGHPKKIKYNQNIEGLLIGHALETFVRDGNSLLMPTVIDDYRGIELIDKVLETGNGYVEASPAYFLSDRIWSDEFNAYMQIGRRYDHEAIGNKGWGRGGQKIILHTDSKDSILISLSGVSDFKTIHEEEPMNIKKVIYQEKTYDVPVPIADYLENLEIENKQLKTQTDSLEAKIAVLSHNLDSKKDMVPIESVGKLIADSVRLWEKLTPIFQKDNADFKPDFSLTPVQIKELYLRKFYPTINLDGKTETFYNDVWELIENQIPDVKPQTDSKVKAQLALLNNHKPTPQTDSIDGQNDEIELARKARLERISKANIIN